MVQVPPLTGGSSVTYRMDGLVWLPTHVGNIIDWSIVGGTPGQDLDPLPAGTIGSFFVAEGTSPQMGADAKLHDARRIALWVHPSDQPDGLVLVEDWIDTQNGAVIQSVKPNTYLLDNKSVILTQFTKADNSPLLFAHSFGIGASVRIGISR